MTAQESAHIAESSAVPFEARRAIQKRMWACLSSDNEWTTWTDAVTLAECAAEALTEAGYVVTLWIDGSPDA